MPNDSIERMLGQFEDFLASDEKRRARIAVACHNFPDAGIMMGEILDVLYGFAPDMPADDLQTIILLISGVLYRRTRKKEENL